jgi:hypothetical protein
MRWFSAEKGSKVRLWASSYALFSAEKGSPSRGAGERSETERSGNLNPNFDSFNPHLPSLLLATTETKTCFGISDSHTFARPYGPSNVVLCL